MKSLKTTGNAKKIVTKATTDKTPGLPGLKGYHEAEGQKAKMTGKISSGKSGGKKGVC